ncbi:broad specificity phosphatase PhoE [Kribbella orskensis]|uniref:Broad specificity phosphatase PhoE n=1 Tax=Kribbella orskensis TaxID=2512216 RepID=A0ABY2BT15_9ACTN|nr:MULTISPECIES: histidine phosphatase family protein [Kribbella]TCN42698.1 broad specificity phosphatase PhoE [Kribbella sp. VKM Ac-2500]TCO29946.1 broad specificity phosphatase PhoE [Kribbella orskensis]
MTQIYLVRHGEPDYEAVDSRRLPGLAADTAPLTPEGAKQAQVVADLLSGIGATYLVSSPFTRALHSAAIIGHRLALGVRVDYDLRDWLPESSGFWRGQADVRAAQAELDEYDGEWPEGIRRAWEPLSQVRERALAALARHTASTDGPVLAITHSMVIRALTGERDIPHGAHQYFRYESKA